MSDDKTIDDHLDALIVEAGGGSGGDDGSGGEKSKNGKKGRGKNVKVAKKSRRISKGVFAIIAKNPEAVQKTVYKGV